VPDDKKEQPDLPADAPRDDDPSLYGPLADPAPPAKRGGETDFTAAKETVDRDQEDDAPGLFLGDR
jgi:hypothetical protein